MTKPISSDNLRFDTSQFQSQAYADQNSCKPAAQSCTNEPRGAPLSAAQLPVGVIDLEPVYVVGDAGVQKLVEGYCAAEKVLAAEACAKAAATGVATGYTAAVVPVFVAGLVSTYLDAKACGRELAGVYNCETEAQ